MLNELLPVLLVIYVTVRTYLLMTAEPPAEDTPVKPPKREWWRKEKHQGMFIPAPDTDKPTRQFKRRLKGWARRLAKKGDAEL